MMNGINGSRRFDLIAQKWGLGSSVPEGKQPTQTGSWSLPPVIAQALKQASCMPLVTPQQQAIQKIQADFEQRFSAVAADKEKFHAMMQEAFGNNYDYATAESFRQRALKGDYDWLPRIEFKDNQTLQ